MGLFGNLFSKNKNATPVENVNTEVTGNDIIIAGEMIKEGEAPKEDPSVYYVLYVNKVSGFKEIPFNTLMLLVNDHSKNNLTINYEVDGVSKTDTISRSKITDVSFNSRMLMENNKKEIVTNEMKSHLAAAALFGGNPLAQYLGGNGINGLLNTMSDNYDKVELNTSFEITLTYLNEENETQKMMFTTTDNPEKFINFLKTTINK